MQQTIIHILTRVYLVLSAYRKHENLQLPSPNHDTYINLL